MARRTRRPHSIWDPNSRMSFLILRNKSGNEKFFVTQVRVEYYAANFAYLWNPDFSTINKTVGLCIEWLLAI